MQGIVSLIEKQYSNEIASITESLKRILPDNWSKQLFYPHFSWHVAENYLQDELEIKIKKLSSSIKSFKIKTAGLGIFTGENPVLYLSLVQTQELLLLHKQLWIEFNSITQNSIAYYHPNLWVPHISLAYGNSFSKHIGKVIEKLSIKDFQWELEIDNLSFIDTKDDTNWILKYKSFFQN